MGKPPVKEPRLLPRVKVQQEDAAEREVDIYTPEGYRVLSDLWERSGWQRKVSYEYTWLGVPIIQTPEDLLMMQELLYKIRPDVVIETGTAHGGTALFYASMLELLGKGRVVSVDIEIRKYNRLAIQAHPLSRRVTLIEGDAIAPPTLAEVAKHVGPRDTVLVALDSNHSAKYVFQELEAYAPFVTPGSYVVVFDGIMASLTDAPAGNPAWGDDNPLTATRDFLAQHRDFEVDHYYNRAGVTYCPDGFLRRKRSDR